ncbi:hypothetical protein LMHOCYYV_CDS0018 [Staphylococcus phage PG-2021_4]
MTTYDDVNKATENYYNHLLKKIKERRVTAEEARKEVTYMCAYQCLKLTDWNVARLANEDTFLAIAFNTITLKVAEVTAEIGKMEEEQEEEQKVEEEPKKDAFTLEFLEKYVPKKYHKAIEEVEKDTLDGYFIYLTEDYISSFSQNHTISELTIADVKKQLKYIMPKSQFLEENNLPSDWR